MTRRGTLREAAEALGISKDAVRKRVSRGTLVHDKGEDGRVYVYLPVGGDAGTDAGEDNVPPGPGATVGDLQDHGLHDHRDELIAELRAEVAAWREESRRKDHIIAGLVERLPPQLEAAPEPRQAPETAPEPSGSPSPRSGTTGRQGGVVRLLWRLLVGG